MRCVRVGRFRYYGGFVVVAARRADVLVLVSCLPVDRMPSTKCYIGTASLAFTPRTKRMNISGTRASTTKMPRSLLWSSKCKGKPHWSFSCITTPKESRWADTVYQAMLGITDRPSTRSSNKNAWPMDPHLPARTPMRLQDKDE
jgi:hypothetical protein